MPVADSPCAVSYYRRAQALLMGRERPAALVDAILYDMQACELDALGLSKHLLRASHVRGV